MRSSCRSAFWAAAVVVLVAIVASAAFAQGQMHRRGQMGGAQMDNVPGLQQYPLSTHQRQQIAGIRTEALREMQQIRREPNLTTQEKNNRINQIMMETHNKVMNVLTDEQRDEFQQWWEQRPARRAGAGAGPGMGMGPMMGTVPGLTQNPLSQEQMDQIRGIRTESMKQMQNVRTDPNLSQEEKTARITQIRQEQHRQVMEVLTPAQQQEFNDWWAARQQRGGMMGNQ